MKVLSLIPKKVQKTYDIERDKNCIEIHSPVYVNIDFDDSFRIEKDYYTVSIKNSKCVVSLYLNTFNVHITIY